MQLPPQHVGFRSRSLPLLLLLPLPLLLLQSVYEIRYRLPKEFTCDRCILQWHYLTGNSCW
jgi:hypothetical protein